MWFTFVTARLFHSLGIQPRLAAALFGFVRSHKLGTVYVESGYILRRGPDTVRGPDISFLSRERAAAVRGRRGFAPFAPDMAVEIRSPSNTTAEIAAKTNEYLEAGTRLVWVVDPPSQTVRVHEPGRAPRAVPAEGVLHGGDVLPGFTLPLAELFSEE